MGVDHPWEVALHHAANRVHALDAVLFGLTGDAGKDPANWREAISLYAEGLRATVLGYRSRFPKGASDDVAVVRMAEALTALTEIVPQARDPLGAAGG